MLMVFVPLTVFVPIVVAEQQDDLATLVVVGLLVTIVPVWLYLTTAYEVDEERLLIRSGPFRWNILLSEIAKVEPSRSVLSSPALSLDRIRIEYGVNKFVLVSPMEKEEFIKATKVDA